MITAYVSMVLIALPMNPYLILNMPIAERYEWVQVALQPLH